MHWLKNRKARLNKPRLLRICFLAKGALDLAFNIYEWANPATNLLGAAVIPALAEDAIEFLDTFEPDTTLEQQYFTAVENSLARVETYFINQHGKRKLIQELASEVDIMDPLNADIKEIIQHAETFQTQYMTSIDVKDILQCFDKVFAEEVAKQDKLSHYYTYTGTRDTLDLLKRIQILQDADSKQLENIYHYVNGIKDDTTQIKSGILELKEDVGQAKQLMLKLNQSITSACSILLHSTLIFFIFAFGNNCLFYVDSPFYLPIEGNWMLGAIFLASEVLTRICMVQSKHRQTQVTLIPLQTCFITVFTLLMTPVNPGYGFLSIPLFSCIGVSAKHRLLYHQKNYTGKAS